jgi:glycosyltransferase involved in cell wall biosynthesis
MRVLYCNKYNFVFSGTEAYLFDVMNLMREKHEVALFSMADPRGAPTPYDRHFLPHIDFKAPASQLTQIKRAGHAVYSRDARLRLRNLIAEFRPDVAHVRNIYHHLSPSILWELKAHDIPVIYHLNDFKLLCPNYNFVAQGAICERCKGKQFWHVVTQGCHSGSMATAAVLAAEAYTHKFLKTYEKCVARFLVPSHFVKAKLVEHGWDSKKIDVLPHFQRLHTPVPPLDRAAPILYAGRLSTEKGLSGLLHAMKVLPDITLNIAGDGPLKEELQNLSSNIGLENATFLGHLTAAQLGEQISSAKFTVFPSLAYETLGKSILESYAWGRPVVASDLGSRREFVREGETGVLFRAGDAGQLSSAIRFLNDRPELAEQMGRAGRELLRLRHDPKTHIENLSLMYESLIQRSHAARCPSLAATRQPSSMRIAFIGGRGVMSKYSGIETYYEEVGSRLDAMGHDVTAYCRPYFTPDIKTYSGINIVRLPTVRTKHIETILHTWLSTVHACFGPYDIVNFHALGPALFSFLPRLFGKKTVVTVQGLDWRRKKWGWMAGLILRAGEHAAAAFPNRTIVVSRTLQEHFTDRHGADTKYIPNGTRVRERPRKNWLTAWGLESDNYILFTGRLSPEKNCDLLIDAYEQLDTPVKLVFAGGSSHSDKYVEKLRSRKNSNIVFLDWVTGEALTELLTHAMLFVLPSDLEGLSLALLDAMGAGVCVLTSDIPENVEAIDGCGYTFRKGDVGDLAGMIRVLISDPKMREVASEGALRKVRQQYLWPRIAESVEDVYRSLLPSSDRAFKKSPVVAVPERQVSIAQQSDQAKVA